MSSEAWVGLATTAFVSFAAWLAYRKSRNESTPDDGNILIRGVDRKDFSRLFAKALVDERGRKVLLGLMTASGRVFTPREELFLRFAVGETDKDSFLEELEQYKSGRDAQEARILVQQVQVLTSVFGTEAGEERK